MNARNIYQETSIGKIQQGYIFNQAISEDYPESDVYGIIITPRCDIENKKVVTFHYLPIVKLEDWLLKDYWINLKNLIIANLHQRINTIFEQNGISKNLLGMFTYDDILERFSDKIKPKKQQKGLIDFLTWLRKISESSNIVTNEFLKEIHEEKTFNKIGNNLLKELTQNNRKEFHLIEDWESKGDYHVILLREINKISWSIGLKIAKGVSNEELSKEEFLTNDIKSVENGFIFPLISLKPPFMEHLIQRFITNFGRIGIIDHENDLCSKIMTKNILK